MAGQAPTIELRPYQKAALDAWDHYVEGGGRRGLIVIPTAGGKTICFAQLPKRYGRTLVLAHREELLEQAAEKLQWANPDLTVAIEQAGRRAGHADLVVASVPTLGRKGSKRLATLGDFNLVVVDEAHHASAETYRRVLDHYGDVLRLGVTATPQRGDKKGLHEVFDDVVYFIGIEEMIKDGWLVAPAGYVVRTASDLSRVKIRGGDYVDSDLARAVDNDERNYLAVEAYRRLATGRRAVVYCVTVEHAEHMAAAFNDVGVSCAVVVGKTPAEDRREILGRFKADCGVDVISSVGVLTEGWDDPGVSCIILARPTRSPLLYTQIIGRSLRLHPGKTDALIIDLADATMGKKPVGLPSLLGLPAHIDCKGKKVTEVAERFRELEQLSLNAAAQVGDVDEIEAAFHKIDLFAPPPLDPEVLAYSRMVWLQVGPAKWVLNLSGDERIVIVTNALGDYGVGLVRRHHATELLHKGPDMAGAFRFADRWVRTERKDALSLVNADARWRSDPPSEAQLNWLEKLGIPVPADLTKGEASRLLDKAFAERPKKPRPQWLEEKLARERAARQRF